MPVKSWFCPSHLRARCNSVPIALPWAHAAAHSVPVTWTSFSLYYGSCASIALPEYGTPVFLA